MSGFDRLAKAYEPLERLSFAGRLQAVRCFCLPCLKECRRGLLVGDGDGRFSAALLRSNPEIQLESIDISRRMLEAAQERAGENVERLRPIATDALQHAYRHTAYDFIGLHFCLDCFSQGEIAALLPKLEAALKPSGLIAYSDFQSKTRWQRVLVKVLYLSFRLSAGLKTRELPDVKWGTKFETIAKTEQLGGLVFSQVLRKRRTRLG